MDMHHHLRLQNYNSVEMILSSESLLNSCTIYNGLKVDFSFERVFFGYTRELFMSLG